MAGLSFQLQSGIFRETISLQTQEIAIKDLREIAARFIKKYYPNQSFGNNVADHILLYRHDNRSVNILQLITTSADVTDGTLVEIVISRKLFLVQWGKKLKNGKGRRWVDR
uniref:Uncharacterized protein n=1 Tax=Panagrolaimus sp. JU765 TaxID=591449 RepID=A0AC34RS29_9BILA